MNHSFLCFPLLLACFLHSNSYRRERDAYYKKSGKGIEEILLSENGQLFEGGQSNFFAIKNGTVYTKGDGVLQGTVRNLVITLCKKIGIPLCLEAPLVQDIPIWDACFITSTSRFIMNINTIRVFIIQYPINLILILILILFLIPFIHSEMVWC